MCALALHFNQVPLAVYEVDVISGSDYLAVGKKNVTKMETKWRVISHIYTG
jgi:hypothetical protein